MSINLPYTEGTREKLGRIIRSHKITSTFYNKNTLREVLCKPKVCLRARLLCMVACSRAWRAWRARVLAYLRAWYAYMLACWRAHVLMFSRV